MLKIDPAYAFSVRAASTPYGAYSTSEGSLGFVGKARVTGMGNKVPQNERRDLLQIMLR